MSVFVQVLEVLMCVVMAHCSFSDFLKIKMIVLV